MTKPIIDLTTNVSQIFTELYRKYSILTNPNLNVFENSLYLEGTQSTSIKDKMNRSLREYHKDEGTLGLYIDPNENHQIFTAGIGSTQLYKGLVYAMVTSHPDKEFLFVQKIPYFSGHADAVNKVFPYLNATYQGYNDPNEIIHKPGQIIVEFVTSPNNPDGEFRKPETDPDVILGDFVFTSTSFGYDGTGYIKRNLEWLQTYREKGTCIFSYNSASKQFGHTGDRFGYMWFPMFHEFAKSIFNQLNNFIATTVGADLYGSSNFLNLLPSLIKYGDQIRKDANDSLKIRLFRVSEALIERYPGSEIESVPGSPTLFVKINDPRLILTNKGLSASQIIFNDTNVETVNGTVYGADDRFVRINIMANSEDLSIFIERLIGEKEKELLICRNKIRPVTICGPTKYVANPNDKYILLDASKGNIKIILPKFLGYEQPLKLKIRRKDNSCHKVKIRSETLKIKLDGCDKIRLIWSQPFYQNGNWSLSHNHKHKCNKREYNHIDCNKEILKLFLV